MLDKIDIGNKYGMILFIHILSPFMVPSDTMPGFIINANMIINMKIGIKFLFNI